MCSQARQFGPVEEDVDVEVVDGLVEQLPECALRWVDAGRSRRCIAQEDPVAVRCTTDAMHVSQYTCRAPKQVHHARQ